MMTPEELKARAERAAEWLETNGSLSKLISASERETIAMAEDRGWRDPVPTEAEAVVFVMKHPDFDVCHATEGFMVYQRVRTKPDEWLWVSNNPVEEATRLGYAEQKGEGED